MRHSKAWIGFLTGFVLLAGSVYAQDSGQTVAKVVRVMDGNVIVIDGGQEIRLIGVAAPSMYDDVSGLSEPEKIRHAEKALEVKNFLKYLIEGKSVRLELDPMHGRAFQHRDLQDRILSYVWFTAPVFQRPPDWLVMDPTIETGYYDAFLNAAVIRAGYARTELSWPFQYGEKFLALQSEAENAKRGFWAEKESATEGTASEIINEESESQTTTQPSIG